MRPRRRTSGLDLLIAVGSDDARALAAAAVGGGMPASAVIHGRPEKAAAVKEALQRVRPGDLVLVKGSRGIGLDLVVDRLKAEFA